MPLKTGGGSSPERLAEIHSDLVMILRDHCELPGDWAPSTRLQADLGLDSMGLLNFALEVENHFQVFLNEPPDQPPETLREVAELVAQALDSLA
ncbi:MAG: hypothetical protein CMH55_08615 [Myxococcales bacterium]|nr:hypothetical protein [Myxococcales bacterium]